MSYYSRDPYSPGGYMDPEARALYDSVRERSYDPQHCPAVEIPRHPALRRLGSAAPPAYTPRAGPPPHTSLGGTYDPQAAAEPRFRLYDAPAPAPASDEVTMYGPSLTKVLQWVDGAIAAHAYSAAISDVVRSRQEDRFRFNIAHTALGWHVFAVWAAGPQRRVEVHMSTKFLHCSPSS